MNTKLLLVIIVAIAFIFRVFAIDIYPLGFTPDEASFGYDAFSILKTGKDQWGHFLPLMLESFGDFKLPLYSYLTIPFVGVFGLTKFAVRLPNAIIGTLAVLTVYFLVNELFSYKFAALGSKKLKRNNLTSNSTSTAWLPLFSALMLAISPWHISMSRGAFEANLTTFILPIGVYFFLKGIGQPKYFILPAIFFGFNLFSYHAARLVTPLVVLSMIFIYRDKLPAGLLKNKKVITSLVVFTVFTAAAAVTLFQGGARRAQGITIFSGAAEEASQDRFIAVYNGTSDTTARIFHNKVAVIVRRFIFNYSQYFSPNFLFVNGAAEATYGMVPGFGVLYLFELPFLMGFIWYLFKGENKNSARFILLWLLIAPLPAALTQGKGYAANRAEIMIPAITIASALGFKSLIDMFKPQITRYRSLSGIVFTGIVLFSAVSFLEQYFLISPFKNSKSMLYGNNEVAVWLAQNSKDKKQIIISRGLSEPHIYVAFANSWDPAVYQSNSKDWRVYKDQKLSFLDQLGTYSLGKYVFSSIDYKAYQGNRDVLMVGRPDEFPENVRPLTKFFYPDGSVAIVVVEPFNEAYAAKIN